MSVVFSERTGCKVGSEVECVVAVLASRLLTGLDFGDRGKMAKCFKWSALVE